MYQLGVRWKRASLGRSIRGAFAGAVGEAADDGVSGRLRVLLIQWMEGPAAGEEVEIVGDLRVRRARARGCRAGWNPFEQPGVDGHGADRSGGRL